MDQLDRILNNYSWLRDDLDSVKRELSRSMHSGYPALDGPLSRFLETPGKMLRPLMVLLSARFAPDMDTDRTRQLAAAVEILHIASLVHDDIVDDSTKRRGITTLHTSEGIRKAVLLGDYLFTRCFSLAADSASPDSARQLAAAVSRICESEISQHWTGTPGHREYRRRIAGKTALLFTLGLSVGAMENGADRSIVQNLRRAGFAMGMGFQIVDDILDYTADERLTGKPGGQDLNGGLDTLPLLLAAESGDAAVRRLIGRKRAGKIGSRRLREAVVRAGGIDMARQWATHYNSLAEKYIASLPDTSPRAALRELSRMIYSRNK